METSKLNNAITAFTPAIRAEKSFRYVLYPHYSGITPSTVAFARQCYELGDFFYSTLLFEAVARYDAQLATCIEKRFSKTAFSDWEISTINGLPEEMKEAATEQVEILNDFFNNLTVASAVALDEEQGVQSLFRHIVSAVAFGYSAAAISYQPAFTPTGKHTLHAKILTCPLSFFEARTRKIRIRENYSDYYGTPLEKEKWIIAHYSGTPLILPSLEPYMAKSSAMQDWNHTVEKFGIPFVVAHTPAEQGSQEWTQAEHAVKNIGSGFSGVVGADVQIDTTSLAQGDAPHERLIDYADRQISRLWLGGDLETMSREGDSVGSEAQSQSSDFIRRNDASFIEQVIDTQITQPILRKVFGDAVPQLAYFRFSVKEHKDINASIAKISTAKELGLKIPVSFVYAELGIPEPQEGETTLDELEETIDNESDEVPFEENETTNAKIDEKVPLKLNIAGSAQYEELIKWVARLETIENEEDFQKEVNILNEKFPEIKNRILGKDDIANAMREILNAAAF